jgi:polysaccharide export outer membrane protein
MPARPSTDSVTGVGKTAWWMLVMVALLALVASSCTTTSRSAVDPPVAGAGNAPGAATVSLPPEVPSGHGSPDNADRLNTRLFRRAAPRDTPGDLPLGPGDLIEISVVNMFELSGRKVRVPRDGGITLPLLGAVPVSGRSPAELEEDLRRRLQEKYMHDPQVSVYVHERRSQRISVLGAVRKGGVLELTGRLRLADALAMAEGLTDDADHVVYVFRRAPADAVARAQAGRAQVTESAAPGTTTETTDVMTAIDLEAIANGNEELNVPLEAGDVIQVPRAGSVYVGGQVARPGSVPLKGKTTVYQAILAAGGPTNIAALGDVRHYRTRPDGQVGVTALDLDEFEAGKGAPEVQKNDVIIVGKNSIKAFVYGTLELFSGVFGVGVGL